MATNGHQLPTICTPMATKKRSKQIRICPQVMAEIVANCPPALNKTAFVNMTLAEALSKSATMIKDKILLEEQHKKAVEERITAQPSNARAICIESDLEESISRHDQEALKKDASLRKEEVRRDPFKSKNIDPSLIPPELQKEADLILEFWAAKKGTRSSGVFKRIINKLLSWTPQDRTAALCSAVAGAWSDLYEPKAVTPKQGPYRGDPGPDMKHPAHRDFTAERIAAERNGNSEGVLSGIF
jgi:hypothetical protein